MAGQETQGDIPDIRKPDIQVLLQDFAQARRDVYEERRSGDRRVSEERERSRWEMERLRADLSEKLRRAEKENDALIASLGRLHSENDRLREEVAILKMAQSNGHDKRRETQTPEASGIATEQKSPHHGIGPEVGKIVLVPPPELPLGKAMPFQEPPKS